MKKKKKKKKKNSIKRKKVDHDVKNPITAKKI